MRAREVLGGAAAWALERGAAAWSRTELRWLGAILILAAAVRVAWILYAARFPQELHDPLFYVFYAAQIANGDGYRLLNGEPSAYYPIGYPATLSAAFALTRYTFLPENDTMAFAWLNVVLGVGTVGLAYELGRRLFDGAVGLVTALVIAVFPNLVYHTGTPLTETLFNFVMVGMLVVIVAHDWRERPPGPWRLAAFGVLLGYSALIRPISLPLLAVLAIVWLGMGFGWRRTLGSAGIALVATVAVILPWTVRNIIVMDAPVLISTNLGDNLCIGHYEGAPGHFALPDVCFAEREDLTRPELELRRDEENREHAIRFALENPRAEVELLFDKARWMWDHDHDGINAVESYGDDPFIGRDLRSFLTHSADVYFFVAMAIGGVGLAGLVRRPLDPRRIYFLLSLLVIALIPLAFFGDARFHVPSIPLVSVATAWALVAGARLGRDRIAQVGAVRSDRSRRS